MVMPRLFASSACLLPQKSNFFPFSMCLGFVHSGNSHSEGSLGAVKSTVPPGWGGAVPKLGIKLVDQLQEIPESLHHTGWCTNTRVDRLEPIVLKILGIISFLFPIFMYIILLDTSIISGVRR